MSVTERTYPYKGVDHPLIEAEYSTAFRVYRSDHNKAIIGDPWGCVEALGLRRMPNVVFACIGSGGDAFVGFKDPMSPTGITVRHFIIKTKAARVRDNFDIKKPPKTQLLQLDAPTEKQTLDYRAKRDKKRRDDIKNGVGEPVKPRDKPRKTRFIRLGVSPRPTAKITKHEVSLFD